MTERSRSGRRCACLLCQSSAEDLAVPALASGCNSDGRPLWHGTLNGYSNKGCRCPDCRRASRIYRSHYKNVRPLRQVHNPADDLQVMPELEDDVPEFRLKHQAGLRPGTIRLLGQP